MPEYFFCRMMVLNKFIILPKKNSPLFSNSISSVVINDDGEVFFGTANGIISFKGTATPGV